MRRATLLLTFFFQRKEYRTFHCENRKLREGLKTLCHVTLPSSMFAEGRDVLGMHSRTGLSTVS